MDSQPPTFETRVKQPQTSMISSLLGSVPNPTLTSPPATATGASNRPSFLSSIPPPLPSPSAADGTKTSILKSRKTSEESSDYISPISLKPYSPRGMNSNYSD